MGEHWSDWEKAERYEASRHEPPATPLEAALERGYDPHERPDEDGRDDDGK